MSGSASNARPLRPASVTTAFGALGGDIDAALERIGVPAFVVGGDGRIRYLNERARTIVGDLRGRPLQDAAAPQSKGAARLDFARMMVGTERVTDTEGWIHTVDGEVLAEVHLVAIEAGERVVGVFGIGSPRPEQRAARLPQARQRLTPRQLEVLGHLAEGRSTAQIAAALGVATETVRNHIRAILRTLGVHSRLEAVVEAYRLGVLGD